MLRPDAGEGIAEGVIDVLDGNTETRGGIAIDDDGACNRGVADRMTSRSSGILAQALLKNGGPMREVIEIVALECVLILSPPKRPPTLRSWTGLQVEGGSGNFGRLRTNAGR